MLNRHRVVIFVLVGLTHLTCCAAQEDLPSQIKAFEKIYALELVLKGHEFSPDQDGIAGADSEQVEKYLPKFFSEFNLYPPEFVKKTGVVKIVFCKNLAYKKQFRAAIPGLGTGILYFDVERGAEHAMYHRSVIHHEYFHLIDYEDDGEIYVDQQWASLNPSGFSYGNGGAKVQDDNSQGLTYNKPGFMNRYSTQGVEEDKAEIFSYLVTEPELMKQRINSDSVVAAKVKMMKQLLNSYSDSLDDEFWKNAATVKRGRHRELNEFLKTVGKTVEKMSDQADRLIEATESEVAKSFLNAAEHLPGIEPFDLYYRFKVDSRKRPVCGIEGIKTEKWQALADDDQQKYTRLQITEENYYFTNYGSPVLFVRALDLVGQSGLETLDGKQVVDFGFGSVGQLRMMASNGAKVTGIDVDMSLKGIYSRKSDVGNVPGFNNSTSNGNLKLLYGRFPADAAIAEATGGGIDVFFSKNTLKRGYIHPAQRVDANRRIDLGVEDAEFIRAVYDRLNPGGFFMIYNFHPQRTPPGDKYRTWSDGRSPFQQTDLEAAGFKVIQFDCDDTPAAHVIAKASGLDKTMDLERDFRATYTLLQK